MARRATDSDTQPLWIEAGEARETTLIEVAPLAPIPKTYHFTADDALLEKIRVGRRVNVPFGRKGTLRPAIVVSIGSGPWSSTLRSVAEVLDDAGELSEHLLELGRWTARYYYAPLGRTLAAMVPQAVRSQRGFVTTRSLELTASTDQLTEMRLGKKQAAIIEALQAAGGAATTGAILQAASASRSSLRALIEKGFVTEAISKSVPEQVETNRAVDEPDFELNDDQCAALQRVNAALDEDLFRALLLFGVSGSGKTEIYIRAMRRVIAAGKQAIMLVPEIALTTQLVQRLAARFERVAVIHSGLSEVERSLAWESIRKGETDVVIGTRSAVFAPCPDPGLIVVDEEQEPSYKNLQSPRFHVRDVAVKRAHLLGIPILLGSATPSLETWHNVEILPAYTRIDLPRRVRELPMPTVRLVDMRQEGGMDGAAGLSRSLCRSLSETLAAKQQAVLLLNRRGYATWLFCTECGRRVECPNCKASMVEHQSRKQMRCHHCHTNTPIPTHCAELACRGALKRAGGGTERIEAQLSESFPDARIHRADSDTMTHADKYRSLVERFAAGDIDILLGTQMIAKGLDFPNVALVGVIGADLAGAGADFRASERLFQLVTQVAGRAGRATAAGQVVVQTQALETPALRFAVNHDFEGFAAMELQVRKSFNMPPLTRIARVVVAGPSDRGTAESADKVADKLRECVEAIAPRHASVLGAHPCAMERIRGRYRHEVLLRAANAQAMMDVLSHARDKGAIHARGATVMVDVDPVALS